MERDIEDEFDSPMVKSHHDSFEQIDEEKDVDNFEVDCVSSNVRLRVPIGSSDEGRDSCSDKNSVDMKESECKQDQDDNE